MRKRTALLAAAAVLAGAAVAAGTTVAGMGPAAAANTGIHFETASATAIEHELRVTLRLQRTNALSIEDSAVDFRTEDLDAEGTSDYDPTRGRVVMGVGQVAATVTVVLVDDDVVEGMERFEVLLTDPHDRDVVVDRATVSVVDDDEVLPPFDDTGAASAGGGPSGRPVRRVEGASTIGGAASVRKPTTASGRTAGAAAKREPVTPFQVRVPGDAGSITSPQASSTPDADTVPAMVVLASIALAAVLARLWFHFQLVRSV